MYTPKGYRRRRTRRTVRGNYVWINGYNAITLAPSISGITQANVVTTLLLPTDWEGGGPTRSIRLERFVMLVKTWGVADPTTPMKENECPYALFFTDASIPNSEPTLVTHELDGPGWPVWALANDRILHFGRIQLGHAETAVTSYFSVTNALPENVVNLKLGRRMNGDDSLRIAVSQPITPVYDQGFAGFWVVQILSRFCLRIGAK